MPGSKGLLSAHCPPISGFSKMLCCACRPGHAAALRLGKGPQVANDVAAVWAGCLRVRERVSQLLSQPGHGSDGVRMLAAKFLENTMLLLTAESSSAPKAATAQHTLLSATLVCLRHCPCQSTCASSCERADLPYVSQNARLHLPVLYESRQSFNAISVMMQPDVQPFIDQALAHELLHVEFWGLRT